MQKYLGQRGRSCFLRRQGFLTHITANAVLASHGRWQNDHGECGTCKPSSLITCSQCHSATKSSGPCQPSKRRTIPWRGLLGQLNVSLSWRETSLSKLLPLLLSPIVWIPSSRCERLKGRKGVYNSLSVLRCYIILFSTDYFACF